ncbi:hypothetical protein [Microbulbifer aggregans]|uniref:hypothetical protein n=1 Tax=Microbulbifer aggregans TaxID=1769779 RepID=UPI0039A60F3B
MLKKNAWQKLMLWYQKTGRHDLPWRRNSTPWEVFVAENLLRRTNAASAASVFPSLIKQFRGPEDVVRNQARWQSATTSLGLPSRSKYFIAACKSIISDYDGIVPSNYSALIRLPGVGHYKANAVKCFAYDIPSYLIDTNTIRIAGRIIGEAVKQDRHRSIEAQKLIATAFGPEQEMNQGRNYALLDLAYEVCTAKSPKCSECPLRADCQFGAGMHMRPGNT